MLSATIYTSVHVLASRSGYTTVACRGDIPEPLHAELELMDWWQDQLPHPEPDELLGSPTAWVEFHRINDRAFVALRRVMPDMSPDFAGRRTLTVVTLLFQESDYVRLARRLDGRSGKGLESIVWDSERWQHWASLRGNDSEKIPLEFDDQHLDPLAPMPLTRIDVRIWAASYPLFAPGSKEPQVILTSSPGTDASIVRLAAKVAKDHTARYQWGIRFAGSRTLATASYMSPLIAPTPTIDLRDQEPLSSLEKEALLVFASLPEQRWITESKARSMINKAKDNERHSHESKQRQIEAERDRLIKENRTLEEKRREVQVQWDTASYAASKTALEKEALQKELEQRRGSEKDHIAVVISTTLLGSLAVALAAAHLYRGNDHVDAFLIGLLAFVCYLILAIAVWLSFTTGVLTLPKPLDRMAISINVIALFISVVVIACALLIKNSQQSTSSPSGAAKTPSATTQDTKSSGL